ncbi:MAG: VWA domain-containing protein [Thermoguttaceae bacterium]|nr:VWA domain-containing protein [Thermoguttaceae bacterium]MDO4425499.1 VWA domain-containing protein [Planctomycetia bacterium]
MKKDYLHICVVLDASGSMDHLTQTTQNTFDEFLETQRKFPGKTVFDLFQFSDEVKHLIQKTDLSAVSRKLMSDYVCGGMTAMNDAICTAIDTLGEMFASMPDSERPEKVLVAILTDGEENASQYFSAADVKQKIEHQKNVYSWEFMFLAANQDSVIQGEQIGLAAKDCFDFHANMSGLGTVKEALLERCCAIRTFPDDKNQ